MSRHVLQLRNDEGEVLDELEVPDGVMERADSTVQGVADALPAADRR